MASAVRVEEANWPTLDAPGTVAALWYLAPLDYDASPAVPLRFANDDGHADGTAVDVYVGTYSDQAWIASGSVTAAGDWLEGDAAMGRTGTVILVAK